MLALAGTRKGREVLVEIKAHEALRDGYAAEENQAVCSAMERAMDALLRSGVVRDEIQKHGEGAMIMGD